jgi:hypothetical protein
LIDKIAILSRKGEKIMNLEDKIIEEVYQVRARTGNDVHVVMSPYFLQEFMGNNRLWLNNTPISEDGFYGQLAGIHLYEVDDVENYEIRKGRTANV